MTMQELLKDFLVSLQAECEKRREKSRDGVCACCPHHGFCEKWKYSPATWPTVWIDDMVTSLTAKYRPPKPPEKSPAEQVSEAIALLKSAERRVAVQLRPKLRAQRKKLEVLSKER